MRYRKLLKKWEKSHVVTTHFQLLLQNQWVAPFLRVNIRLKLKALLEPFGITRYYTDYWGAYTRHLDPEEHTPGKQNTQKIERKHLTLRTRIKRLVRKTICFSKSTQMHDIVIGLFVNRYAFGRAV